MYFMRILLLLTINSGICINALQEHVCDTVDVRNYTNLYKLQNCTVIIGNLILIFPLIEGPNYTRQEINSLSFPLR